MNQLSIWFDQWKSVAGELTRGFLLYLPLLIGALLVIVLGWIIARIGRTLVVQLAQAFNRLLATRLTSNRWIHVRLSEGAINIIGDIVFWLLMLVALTAAARTARIDFFAVWLDRMLSYLPGILAGTLIAFVGYLASLIVRDVATVGFSGAGAEQSRFLGRAAQAFVVVLALVVGLEQAGIDVAFLTVIIAIAVGSAAAAVSLAFGLGARSFVGDLIGAYHMQRYLRPGQHVRIGETEGEVLELTPTGIVLSTRNGRSMIPGKAFNEQTIVHITPDRDHD